jgi:hypothetical protein
MDVMEMVGEEEEPLGVRELWLVMACAFAGATLVTRSGAAIRKAAIRVRTTRRTNGMLKPFAGKE